MNIGYIYEKLVLSGLLENIITAPLKDSSLQRRALMIMRSIYTLQDEDFPPELKEDWRRLKAANQHSIDPRKLWITKVEDETAAQAMSLTRKESREFLRSYINIVIEVTKRKGAASIDT